MLHTGLIGGVDRSDLSGLSCCSCRVSSGVLHAFVQGKLHWFRGSLHVCRGSSLFLFKLGLVSERGRYGTGKEGVRIRKIWLILWKPSLLLSQGGSRARQGGACPKAPQGHKYNPIGAPIWLPIDIHSSESRLKMRERVR
jgi:hypothetical protein